jgi:pimeloyl-ACP methyl ester carboxylesterase
MQSVTVDLDGPYHYADYGGDGPPMVLLHGIGGSHINWMLVAPKLAERFHVYALDLIGFGCWRRATRRWYRGWCQSIQQRVRSGAVIMACPIG